MSRPPTAVPELTDLSRLRQIMEGYEVVYGQCAKCRAIRMGSADTGEDEAHEPECAWLEAMAILDRLSARERGR